MAPRILPGMSNVTGAVDVLRRGGLVALPTETVYGLAADASDEVAVRRIFAVKGRPSWHPVIVHLASVEATAGWCRTFPPAAQRLAAAFWPGPLTLVLQRARKARDVVTAGQDTVALRVPSHPVARAVLEAFGGGLAAPSANRFGRISPTRASHVADDLGDDVDLILDGGDCDVGIESTIVDLTGSAPSLLRPGGISREALEQALGTSVPERPVTAAPRVPGSLKSHYAPHAGVVLVDREELPARVEALLRLGKKVGVIAPKMGMPEGVIALEAPEDASAFARVLYGLLREGDHRGCDVLVVEEPEERGVGLALHDRLRRAAAPRDEDAPVGS